ncbi:hypothetical protein [Comamonas sp. NLF-1-9]|uniref:hypothetical protein n=1 Tax=Comamonas sp. NLF-1-9 TaxID=2853163 RepID=UPI001C47E579|nr:hypothetical protein [Comamonas sp. NLF-1-9]QXL84255.1 hypothetical protein KUD94_13670 [Comamonas sp. NLF-1-9]
MSLLARLRRSATRLSGRVLLLWFALALGAAAAAPVLQPAPAQDICTSAPGWSADGPDTGSAPAGHTHLNCPLCLPVLPPPAAWTGLPCAAPLAGHWLGPAATTLTAGHALDVPPARGPPQA